MRTRAANGGWGGMSPLWEGEVCKDSMSTSETLGMEGGVGYTKAPWPTKGI